VIVELSYDLDAFIKSIDNAVSCCSHANIVEWFPHLAIPVSSVYRVEDTGDLQLLTLISLKVVSVKPTRSPLNGIVLLYIRVINTDIKDTYTVRIANKVNPRRPK
jgi:hypothetical protein